MKILREITYEEAKSTGLPSFNGGQHLIITLDKNETVVLRHPIVGDITVAFIPEASCCDIYHHIPNKERKAIIFAAKTVDTCLMNSNKGDRQQANVTEQGIVCLINKANEPQ